MTDLPKGKPILCLDFDGVLHSYSSGWQGACEIPDPPVAGAMAFILEAMENFEVCIYSSRSRYFGGKGAMKRWLFVHLFSHLSSIEEDKRFKMFIDKQAGILDELLKMEVNVLEQTRIILKRLKFPTRKPAAFLQIDDRAMTFNGTFPTIEEIKSFKPWNKRNLQIN